MIIVLTPPLDTVNSDARRRLKAIEDFSGLGSGFNIAMQDLDIRGAGNILGAEQSGFIAEIGYETYQRILNEALLELREEEFPGMETPPTEQKQAYVADCVIIFPFFTNNLSIPKSIHRRLILTISINPVTCAGISPKRSFSSCPNFSRPASSGILSNSRYSRILSLIFST